MKEYKELKLKKKIYSIMNCYEKAGNLYQMIESLIQVFVYHHVFERSCRWQVLEIQTIPRERMQELFFRKEGEKRTWKEDYLRQNQ